MDIAAMTTMELITLMTNILVQAKQKAIDEYAGTELPNTLNQCFDDAAGCMGEAKAAIDATSQSNTDASNTGPSVPQPAPNEAMA